MRILLLLLALATLGAAQDTQHFIGTIADSECATAGHAAMRMGDTDAECVLACVDAHGASYVLLVGASVYGLSDQKAPAAFAARKVQVTGRLDPRTMTVAVSSIVAAN